MGRVGHNNMGASNALYDRSLLDWRKAQKTKASFGGTGVASMKVGDLVKLNSRMPILKSLLGIIIDFDEDNDPIVQWFENGGEFSQESEYRNQIKVI